MEHYSSFNNYLRKEITARDEMNKEIRTLKGDIDKNIEEIYNVDIETKRIKKFILKEEKKIELIPSFL